MEARCARFFLLGCALALAATACGAEPGPARLYAAGEAALEAGQIHEAAVSFGAACNRDPAYRDACERLGGTLDASMVPVPTGAFIMGSDDTRPSEAPLHNVYLDAFQIDVYEVTNTKYARFVQARGGQPPPAWDDGAYPAGEALFPVSGVLWGEADAYCAWAGKRLPSEAEWEKAARGVDGRAYPWGEVWEPGLANTAAAGLDGPAAVGSYPASASTYGALDMAGNVWEWVADAYERDYYRVSPERNPSGPDAVLDHGLRGGAFDSDAEQARAAFRNSSHSVLPNARVGFRCAR